MTTKHKIILDQEQLDLIKRALDHMADNTGPRDAYAAEELIDMIEDMHEGQNDFTYEVHDFTA